ncbi:LON peptidase substrate-binding domain-containing protein [Moritella dasanensis]|uniref:LON peptidase substrate-binding domain-containing protein n=1 Tax=Moritella dasanensis TaxID=428031 RepID=UPI000308FE9B|nr:LON peptidase substrate-binding domain-containing protein [Moritella dasanensis]
MMLAIFPLPIVLLPGGVTRLSIFEPKYMRLVTESYRNGGFALLPYNQSKTDSTLATADHSIAAWVEIIDFNTSDDGLLSIDIKAKRLIEITAVESDVDGLLKGRYHELQHWPDSNEVSNIDQNNSQNRKLTSVLSAIFEEHQNLASLYPHANGQDLRWVCARFIELLPLDIKHKINFMAPESFEQCLAFLHTTINGHNNAPA